MNVSSRTGLILIAVATHCVTGAGFLESLKSVVRGGNTATISNNAAGDLYLRSDGDNAAIGDGAQVWELDHLGNSICRLKPQNDGDYLSATDGSDGWDDGDNVELSNWSNQDNQKWLLQYVSPSLIKFKNVAADLYLNASNGDNVSVSSWDDNGSFKWDIERKEKIDSPGIGKAPNGDLIVYLKTSGVVGTVGMIYSSSDRGENWSKIWETSESIYGPTLFTHDNKLYMLGCRGKDFNIYESTDNGNNWSKTTLRTSGEDLLSGGGAPVLMAGGYLYYCFMDKADSDPWPGIFRLCVASCRLDESLTDGSNWTLCDPLSFPSNPAVDNTREGWLEHNPVSYDGKVWLIARVDAMDGVAACVELSSDRTELYFENRYPVNGENDETLRTGFMDAQWAGSNKFHILQDSHDGTYWIVSNPNNGPKNDINPHKTILLDENDRFYDRNELAIYTTSNFREFTHIETLIEDDLIEDAQESVNLTGFQQAAFIFDDDDILIVSRTAYGSFDVYHDANMITYHEYLGFREGQATLAGRTEGATPLFRAPRPAVSQAFDIRGGRVPRGASSHLNGVRFTRTGHRYVHFE